MKKNGFTLVELLAVIAILAILVVLILPNVLELFRGSKKNAFITETQSVYKTLEGELLAKSLKTTGNEVSGIYTNINSTDCPGSSATINDLAIMNSTIKYYIVVDYGKVSTFVASNEAYFVDLSVDLTESATSDGILSDDITKDDVVTKITPTTPTTMCSYVTIE